jgi:hypothetical protein
MSNGNSNALRAMNPERFGGEQGAGVRGSAPPAAWMDVGLREAADAALENTGSD